MFRRRDLLFGVVLSLTIAVAPRADENIDATQRLAGLAKVWGLLKYFHPAVAQGTIDWDATLVAEIPRVDSAATKPEFNDELMRFIASAGPQPAVRGGAALDQPESDSLFAWIDDATLFETSKNSYYRGQVLLLADERTQSHAEFTLMALKTAPDVTRVGSQTAGADGNVSLITLPGGMQTYFSGLGVYFPDGRNTQRIGIVPDVEVHPTIAGVDEELQRALALVR